MPVKKCKIHLYTLHQKSKIQFAPRKSNTFAIFDCFAQFPSNPVLHFTPLAPSIYYAKNHYSIVCHTSPRPHLSQIVKKIFANLEGVTAPYIKFLPSRDSPLTTTQRPDEPRKQAKKEQNTPPHLFHKRTFAKN